MIQGGAAVAAAGVALPVTAAEAAKRKRADVVVVGGGLAGLTAARLVRKAGKSVLLLEARRRVGGRTLNHVLADGTITELGGTFIGPTQTHIRALAEEVGTEFFPTYNTGNNVFYANGRREEFPSDSPFGSAPPDPLVAGDIATVVTQLDDMATKVNVDKPWEADNAKLWDGQTLETWLRQNSSGSDEFLAVATAATEAIFGAEPRDLSLLYTLFYIAASGDEKNQGTFERNFNTGGGAQETRFVGGAQGVSIRLAKQLGKKRVLLGTPVRRIEQRKGHVNVIGDHLRVTAKQVIVAVPPNLAQRIIFSPDLPSLRDQLMQRIAQGTLRKFKAIYDTPFWRDKGLTGQSVSENGPIKVTFDVSPPSGKPGVMMGFIGGSEARFWARQPESARREAAMANLVKLFGDAAAKPREIVEFDWAAERWSRGCPVALLSPGTLVDFGIAIRPPVGRIHWAGTETSTYWNGYMDGAVRSGERAAAEALASL